MPNNNFDFAGMEKNSIYICGEYRVVLLDKEFSRKDLDTHINAYMVLHNVAKKDMTFQFFGGGRWNSVLYKELYKIEEKAIIKFDMVNKINENEKIYKNGKEVMRE